MLINKENYSMLKILLIALSCFFAFGSFGQELTIKRDSQIKSFKENSVYFIVLSKVKSYKKDSCCNYTEALGSITSIEKDSLVMRLQTFSKSNVLKETEVNYIDISWDNILQNKIAKSDILYFKNYKSFKSKNLKKKLSIYGSILMLSTGVTMLNTLVIKDKVSRQNLYKLSALQLGCGLTLAIIGSKKRHYITGYNRSWTITN